MRKLILVLSLIFVSLLTWAPLAYAADLVVKIEEPKSPTNKHDFKLGFVALDVQGRAVSVDCYFKKPSGSFSLFETKSLAPGGDSDYCQVTPSQISERGTYNFYVTAKAGADSTTSSTVSVEFDDVAPGTPTNYSKEQQPDACSFKVKFKTADDGGETSRVELYRSENQSFAADASTHVASLSIGSNQNGEFYTTLPDCTKTYFFAIRAFDGHGNGSGVVGDTGTAVTTPPTEAEEETTAIPVDDSQVSRAPQDTGEKILGEKVDGDEEAEETPPSIAGDKTAAEIAGKFPWTKVFIGIVMAGAFLGVLIFFLRHSDEN